MKKRIFSGALAMSMVLAQNIFVSAQDDTDVDITTYFSTTNLVENGGFETGDLSGWQKDGADVFSVIEDDEAGKRVYNGRYALNAQGAGGYLYQEFDAVQGKDYVISLIWSNLSGSVGKVRVYGDEVSDDNILTTVGNNWGGASWFSSTASFNAGNHKKLILRIETLSDTYFCLDGISLNMAGGEQRETFEKGHSEMFKNRSTVYTVSDEDAKDGDYSLKLDSRNGYSCNDMVFALTPGSQYSIAFDYHIVSGSLGYKMSYSKGNGWGEYEKTQLRNGTVGVSDSWQTFASDVISSGSNNRVHLAFQNMAENTVAYIDNIRCISAVTAVDSITVTGKNESDGVLKASVDAKNYAYDALNPGDAEKTTFVWQRSDNDADWTDIPNATGSEYTLTRRDSNKYLRVAAKTYNSYVPSISDTYYSDSIAIGDTGYKYTKGSTFGVDIADGYKMSIDDDSAAAAFECVNNTDDALDFTVYTALLAEDGSVIDYSEESFSDVASGESAKIDKTFAASDAAKFKILVYGSDMELYYADEITESKNAPESDSVKFDEVNYKITVNAKTDKSPVLVKAEDPNGKIIAMDAIDTSVVGGYEKEIDIDKAVCGQYNIYAGNFEKNPVSVYYYSDEEIEAFINTLNSEVQKEDIAKICGALGIENKLLDEIDAEKLAAFINSDKTVIDGADISEKKENAISFLNKALAVEAYNENLTTTDSDSKMLYAEVLNLKDIDSDSVTIYGIYEKILNKDGFNMLDERLKGKDLKSIDEFIKLFKEETVLSGIANPNSGGTGYLEEIITEKNIEEIGIKNSPYFTRTEKEKEAIKKSIMKKTFESVSALESALAEKPDISDSGSTGGSSSGSSGSKKNNTSSGSGIVVPTKPVEETKPDDTQKTVFADVSDSHWAYKYIYALSEANIINGIDEEHFMPENTVTREQFVKMICEALDIKMGENSITFSDVEPGAWYEPYVKIAASQGIIGGKGNGEFGIGENITREDMCVIALRALNTELSETELTFTDSEEISDYAKEAVATLSMLKVISGFNSGEFRPKDSCTRAQAAKITYELMNIKEVVEE